MWRLRGVGWVNKKEQNTLQVHLLKNIQAHTTAKKKFTHVQWAEENMLSGERCNAYTRPDK